MRDAGCGMRDAGCEMRVAGCATLLRIFLHGKCVGIRCSKSRETSGDAPNDRIITNSATKILNGVAGCGIDFLTTTKPLHGRNSRRTCVVDSLLGNSAIRSAALPAAQRAA